MNSDIRDTVRANYASVAASKLSSHQAGVRAVAEAFGYSPEEIAAIPAEANMGLSCGNPVAHASLKRGERVVDLGCGGGLDVFLAAAKVGPEGKAIGIDMTPEMLARARANGAKGVNGVPYTNVEFHLATIDQMPLPDASVDCVISNCVINLAPDKGAVFKEIARVLKPGGRLAVSDLVVKQPLPPTIAQDVMAYVGCIAGAITVQEYCDGLRAAGFEGVDVRDAGADLNAYLQVDGGAGCCSSASGSTPELVSLEIASTPCGSGSSRPQDEAGPIVHAGLREVLMAFDVNEYVASVKIFAVKPPLKTA